MSMLTSEEYNALRTRVKAEMNRRCYNGSLSGYYNDNIPSAAIGGTITTSQGINLIKGLLTATDVDSLNVSDIVVGNNISESFNNTIIDTALSKLEKVAATSSSGGCKASCTGLCQGNCSTGCSGCSGCSGCGSACSSCTGCDGCSGCGGSCSVCTGCTGCSGCGSGCSGCSGCGSGCSSGCSGCSGCSTGCGCSS